MTQLWKNWADYCEQRPVTKEQLDAAFEETRRRGMEYEPDIWLFSAGQARRYAAPADGLRLAWGQLAVGTFTPRAFRLP